jgi:hypothetical protein
MVRAHMTGQLEGIGAFVFFAIVKDVALGPLLERFKNAFLFGP